jgi:hypothetical protein
MQLASEAPISHGGESTVLSPDHFAMRAKMRRSVYMERLEGDPWKVNETLKYNGIRLLSNRSSS